MRYFTFLFLYEVFMLQCVVDTEWAGHISRAQEPRAAGSWGLDSAGWDWIPLRVDVLGRSTYGGVTACAWLWNHGACWSLRRLFFSFRLWVPGMEQVCRGWGPRSGTTSPAAFLSETVGLSRLSAGWGCLWASRCCSPSGGGPFSFCSPWLRLSPTGPVALRRPSGTGRTSWRHPCTRCSQTSMRLFPRWLAFLMAPLSSGAHFEWPFQQI